MAAFGFTFDASQIAPGGALDVIPAGDYRMMIVDSVMEQTKSGTGAFLKLELQVLDGPHQGATLFDRLNLINDNPKAVEIAQRTLSAICHAVDLMQVQDSTQLHNRPMVVRVAYDAGGTRPDGKGGFYGPSNEIKGYKAPTAAQTAPPAFAQPSAPPAQFQPPAAPQQGFRAPPPPAPAPAAAVPPWAQGRAAA
ncbi:MAG: hypothetical protein RL456_2743 [Pseudomonadota bacterium]|jgi:hypothetical protein